MIFDQNIQQLVILFGAFVGNFVTTMIPYWKAKLEFEEFDIKIIFDHKFLATALVSGITSFALIGSAYTSIIDQVDSSNTTLVLAFLAAAAVGAGLNKGFNLAIPSPNVEQKQQLETVKSNRIIADWEEDQLVFNIKKDNDDDGTDWKNTELTNNIKTDEVTPKA